MINNYTADEFFTKGTGNVVICGSTKKEIDFIEKLGIPYFWFNGKEFSGETTITPKDHLSNYLSIMEDINNGTFEV